MNTLCHHRIINNFVDIHNLHLYVDTLKNASDYSDKFLDADSYYLYHFYYNLKIKGHTIMLSRTDEQNREYGKSMDLCGEVYSYPITKQTKYSLPFSSSTDKKEFFSIINERKKSPKIDYKDVSNQSDNVSFIHAMGEKNDSVNESKKDFVNHIRRCFTEYLFIQEEEKALFILGIALHGIMDSFTPSHTCFQQYSAQDMACHAQGDVIPMKGDSFTFDPAQYNTAKELFTIQGREDIVNLERWCAKIKGYNNDDTKLININEYLMLFIFLIVNDVSYINNRKRLSSEEIYSIWRRLGGRTKSNINYWLKKEYCYGENAYIFYNYAIKTISQVYSILKDGKSSFKSYSDYKNQILGGTIVDEALNVWETNYDTFINSEILQSKIGRLKILFSTNNKQVLLHNF